jgi:hypothetical protein
MNLMSPKKVTLRYMQQKTTAHMEKQCVMPVFVLFATNHTTGGQIAGSPATGRLRVTW